MPKMSSLPKYLGPLPAECKLITPNLAKAQNPLKSLPNSPNPILDIPLITLLY